ncbi:MAG: hypothetical protein A2270_05620 [Elusimicrobia bacterium RIFOXYA12_FULL_51_18]|nr:MAG: hypothetical protein A2270_05620 [Elusimicrobia bacterium RIFOXYA12_FULL_51_18]OGS28699.1 MAG: hypothetical protein A2218_11045 [Elusimicrobia bacterium RIFOXYA2_FULL_53_38]
MHSSSRLRKGFGLVEAMMAIFVLSLLSLSLAYMYQYMFRVFVKTQQNTYTTRLAEMAFTKFKTVEYYYLFDCDSALPSFGLTGTFGPVTQQRTSYSYLGILNAIDSTVKKYKIDRWTVSVIYKIRDVSDVNSNGLTGDLRDFTDANGDKIDDYDPSIKYYKANPASDSDYYDTYTSTSLNKTVSEAPDTNLKEVTLKFYRKGSVVHTQTELISLEMLTGIESKSSGAELKLLLSQPENNSYLYNLMTTARANAFALGISKSYPADLTAYRADAGSPITLAGETSPLSTVKVYRNSIGTVLDTFTADSLGNFSFWASGLTTALTEGESTIYVQATKDTFFSPYTPRKVILDLKPPEITGQTPTGTVNDLVPYVGAVLTDTILSTGIASGICEDVTTMKVNGSTVPFAFTSATGRIKWEDPATGLPVKLTNGNSYTVLAEGGDRAGHKAATTWNFTVDVDDTDNSAPSIANKVPSGFTAEPMPEISCKVFDNQSGIDLDSITMKLDGVVVVSSANISGHWDAEGQRVFYQQEAAFTSPSSHTVEVTASHWANDPPDKKTSVDTWDFNVNY